MPAVTLTKKELEILETLHWYFSKVGNNLLHTPEEDETYSVQLGKLIHGLSGEFKYLCALANGELQSFTKELEYEYIGRGLLDPFYRLTHSNDDCFKYAAYQIMGGPKNWDDGSELMKIRRQGVSIEGMKALMPFIILFFQQEESFLMDSARIGLQINGAFLTKLKGSHYIAWKSTAERSSVFNLNQAQGFQKNLAKALEVNRNAEKIYQYVGFSSKFALDCLNGLIGLGLLVLAAVLFPPPAVIPVNAVAGYCLSGALGLAGFALTAMAFGFFSDTAVDSEDELYPRGFAYPQ